MVPGGFVEYPFLSVCKFLLACFWSLTHTSKYEYLIEKGETQDADDIFSMTHIILSKDFLFFHFFKKITSKNKRKREKGKKKREKGKKKRERKKRKKKGKKEKRKKKKEKRRRMLNRATLP